LYRDYLAAKEVAISFMTIAELRCWAHIRRWGPRRNAGLDQFLSRFTVYYADDMLCHAWAEITARCEVSGNRITPSDAWIAAPAWLERVPLVTHNQRHFINVEGLEVVSFLA
jgi:predicted nucleic acid-binding protein